MGEAPQFSDAAELKFLALRETGSTLSYQPKQKESFQLDPPFGERRVN